MKIVKPIFMFVAISIVTYSTISIKSSSVEELNLINLSNLAFAIDGESTGPKPACVEVQSYFANATTTDGDHCYDKDGKLCGRAVDCDTTNGGSGCTNTKCK